MPDDPVIRERANLRRPILAARRSGQGLERLTDEEFNDLGEIIKGATTGNYVPYPPKSDYSRYRRLFVRLVESKEVGKISIWPITLRGGTLYLVPTEEGEKVYKEELSKREKKQ